MPLPEKPMLNKDPLRLPSKDEMAAATESLLLMNGLLSATSGVRDLTLLTEKGERHTLSMPALALRLLGRVLSEMAVGHAITVVAIPGELNTKQAADLLHASRSHVSKLLDEGALPYTRSGSRRLIKLADLVSYKAHRDAVNLATMDKIAAQAQALRLGYE